MSVESIIAATEASAASAPPVEEPKVAPPTTETPAVEAPQPAEEQPTTEVPATPETAAVTEDETEPDLDATPETSGDFAKYKHLFAENPELRAIVGREKAFSELGNFSEVREIVQRIPTLEDANVLAESAENLKVFSESFKQSPAEFAERLAEIDKPAYIELVKRLQSPEVLAEVAPDVLRNRVEYDVHRALEASYAHATPEQQAALNMVAAMWNYRQATAPAPAQSNSELEKLKAKLAERDQADAESRFTNFWSGVDEVIVDTSITDIQASIAKAFEKVPVKLTEKQTKRITQEAWDSVKTSVFSQPQTVAQLKRYQEDARKGKTGNAEKKAITDYVLARVRRQIPLSVKPVVSEWTRDVLQIKSTEIDKKKVIADRTKDVGTGVQGTTSAAAGTPEKPVKKTFNSVFERLNAEVAAMRSGASR